MKPEEIHKKKNNLIEVLRFGFSLVIVFLHFPWKDYGSDLFRHGHIAVEFFFILSGFFIAKSAKNAEACDDPGRRTFGYVLKKIRSWYIPFLLAWLTAFIIYGLVNLLSVKTWVFNLISSIPELLFLHDFGVSGVYSIPQTWYLSAMLAVTLIVYPLIIRFKDTYIYCLAPVFAFVLMGFIGMQYGSYEGVELQCGLFKKSMIRAFSDINLGVFVFGLHEYFFCEKNISGVSYKFREKKAFMGIIETLCYILAFAYAALPLVDDSSFEFSIVLIMAGGLLITFGQETFLNRLFSTREKLCRVLGECSFYIFLIHYALVPILHVLSSRLNMYVLAMVYLAATLILAVCVNEITRLIRKREW